MFLDPNKIKAIYLHIEHVDFRKGIYGLCGCVRQDFGGPPSGVNLFVFTNRYRNKARVLYWDDTGYALWHKALEKDKFRWPKHGEREIIISADQLKWLLAGLSIEELKPHKKRLAKAFY